MSKEDENSLIKSVQTRLAGCDIMTQRRILWNLLRNSVAEDAEGIKWLYHQLLGFVEGEFNIGEN